MTEDPTCTDCGGTGETYQTERRCACQPPIMTEATKHTPELLPCPFCGSQPRAWEDCDMGYSRYGRFWWNVCCIECDVGFRDREEFDDQGLLKHPAQECFTRWNTRSATSQALLIESLTKALEELHATVWGECPRLLNEDSGGCARLDMAIRTALASAQRAKEQL